VTRPRLAAICFVVIAAVAWASPPPDRVTDRGTYELTAERVIVPDCSDLQCFRVLVPWILGRLPGPSAVRWKTYAVVSNTAAALGVWVLCLNFGMTRRAAVMAAAMSAAGFGSFYTVHDPYTSDPLMYAIGPFLTNELIAGRIWIAGVAGVVGVLAKEFAAAPLYAFAVYCAAARQWKAALRAVVAGNAAFILWAFVTIGFMLRFNYSWGWNGVGSADLTGGSALALWARQQSVRGMAFAMFNEFGALYALAPVGFVIASSRFRRLVVASLPIAAIFAYVQQPDRALWNFHYLVTPLAALVLERAPQGIAWGVIVLFAIGNLRVAAQMPIATVAHLAIAGSLVLAVAGIAWALRPSRDPRAPGMPIGAAAR
jgi:hypothetical protein